MALATWLAYYFDRRQLGDKFAAHLEGTYHGASNRESYRALRPIALAIGIGASILNFLAYDCYLAVDRETLRYSPFLTIVDQRVPISEIVSATTYEQRYGLKAQVVNVPYLRLHLRDRSTIKTDDLIEADQIKRLLEAIENARGEALPVTHKRGPWP